MHPLIDCVSEQGFSTFSDATTTEDAAFQSFRDPFPNHSDIVLRNIRYPPFDVLDCDTCEGLTTLGVEPPYRR
jgi:hypothetical protein